MGNIFANPNLEQPMPDMRSSLGGKTGKGSERDKRHSVGEYATRLNHILSILPENSKEKLGQLVESIRKNPERAIEIIRGEVEAQRTIIDMLDDKVMTTDEALRELDKLLPKNKIN